MVHCSEGFLLGERLGDEGCRFRRQVRREGGASGQTPALPKTGQGAWEACFPTDNAPFDPGQEGRRGRRTLRRRGGGHGGRGGASTPRSTDRVSAALFTDGRSRKGRCSRRGRHTKKVCGPYGGGSRSRGKGRRSQRGRRTKKVCDPYEGVSRSRGKKRLERGEVEDIARGSEPTATQKGRGTTVHLSGRMIAEKRSAREPDGVKVNRHRLRRTRGQGNPCSFVVHIKP